MQANSNELECGVSKYSTTPLNINSVIFKIRDRLRRYVFSEVTMCVIQQGLLSKAEGDNMTSQAGHHGGVSQLYPKQGFVKIKTAGEDVLNRLRTLFRSICFCKELVFLFSMAFMLTHAQGEEQTGICKLMDPAIIWDLNSVVNFEMKGLCPSSSTKQLPTQHMNVCIPHVHITTKVHSPDPLGRLSPSKANVKVVIMVLAIIGGIGLAGRVLYERRPAFTEADINRGLASEPAVPRRSDRTFEIPPNILGIAD